MASEKDTNRKKWDIYFMTIVQWTFLLEMSQTFVFLKEPNQSVNLPSLTCPVGRIDQRSGNCIFFKTANLHFLTLHVYHLCWSFTEADKPGTSLHKKQVSKLSKNWHVCIIWISSKLGIHLKKTMAFLVTTPLKHHFKSTTCTFPFYIFVLYLPPRFLLSSFSDCL